MNHNSLGPVVVWLDSRKHKLHLVGQMQIFNIIEMSKKAWGQERDVSWFKMALTTITWSNKYNFWIVTLPTSHTSLSNSISMVFHPKWVMEHNGSS